MVAVQNGCPVGAPIGSDQIRGAFRAARHIRWRAAAIVSEQQ